MRATDMSCLRTTAQSFDLFDTLIARACVTPENLFAEVELAQQVPGFAQCRIEAERRVASLKEPFSLDTIYEAMRESGFCDTAAACRLQKAEIEAEFDNAIPITRNLEAVRDHDLVVSDMYLPASILRGLLQHVGLRRHVHLFVSNRGKHDGSIWPLLTDKWLLLHHTGDNPHADVFQAQRFCIPTRHYSGASPNPTELFLHEQGLIHTARLVRKLRLSNPLSALSVEGQLWNHFVQFSVPILLLAVHAARTQRDTLGLRKLLFLSRDCHLLSEVFLVLFPEEPFDLIAVSRDALKADPSRYVEYLQSMGSENSLVCDLVSTGYSWLTFTQSMNLQIAFFALVYTDTYQYNLFDPSVLDHDGSLRFRYAVRSSELNHWSLAIELFNTAPHGSTRFIEKIGDTFIPTFEEGHELSPSFLRTIQFAQASSIGYLRQARDQIVRELLQTQNTKALLAAMISALSGTDWINHLAVSTICKLPA